MVSYTTRMPIGFIGRISRENNLLVEAAPVNQANPPLSYGVFVKLVSGLLNPIAASDAASVIWGVLVSPFPAQSSSNAFGGATPYAGGIADVLRRGYIVVALTGGTAVKGAQVYVVTTAGTGFPVGSIVTSASPGASAVAVAVPNTTFEGPADANGNVEIAYNI